ncbi:DUF3168 domain-containing protein [Maricaulis maris]|uniref:DUF3168 domain-containing protein n=1 Tax=Maricaulis maris TaxID=74318 RepID=UPI0030C7363F
MSGVVEALRAALETGFAADPAVMARLGDPLRLYQSRAHRAAYPHASWSRVETVETGADGVRLLDVRLGLDVWQRDSDPGPVLDALADAVIALATPDLPAPWHLVTLHPTYRDVFATRDRRLRRGVLRVRAVLGALPL